MIERTAPKHLRFDEADPNSVIITLFRGTCGMVRGWYIGPPSFHPEVPMSWHTSPRDNMLGPIALLRAVEIARTLGLSISIVDPDDLWSQLTGTRSPLGSL